MVCDLHSRTEGYLRRRSPASPCSEPTATPRTTHISGKTRAGQEKKPPAQRQCLAQAKAHLGTVVTLYGGCPSLLKTASIWQARLQVAARSFIAIAMRRRTHGW